MREKTKRLSLNLETIANLNYTEMDKVHGGNNSAALSNETKPSQIPTDGNFSCNCKEPVN
ncbi:MAG: hypothetical protein GY757_35560 [bacterium]|nr:hypothetical protein [bacterium]